MSVTEIYVDGACSGNPGEAAIGAIFKNNGQIVKEISKSIGAATNNIAEYTALIFALQEALVSQIENVKVYTDSELMYRQIIGHYKIKNEKLKLLNEQIQILTRGFKSISIEHIRREGNKEADALAVKALKKKQIKMTASLFVDSGEESPSSKG